MLVDIIGLTGKFVQYEKVQVCFKFQVSGCNKKGTGKRLKKASHIFLCDAIHAISAL